MSPLLAAILAYVALQLVIGFVVSRGIRTEDDYLVAGRRMGPVLVTATMFATWFGAETCLGGAGSAYADGVSAATAEPFAYGLCIVLMGVVFAARLWRGRITTLADVLRRRYGPGVERLAALILIPTSVLWAAAQVRAFGQVLASVSELDVRVAVTVAAGIVVTYTLFGGLLADAITDLVQGGVLLVGLCVLLCGVVVGLGGPLEAVRAIPADSLRFLPQGASALELLEAWSIPILGSVVAQELVVRASAARSARVARGGAILAGSLYVVVGLVPVTLGLLGRELHPGLEDPESVLPVLAREQLGPILFVVFAGALVSAILSTVDSTLLVASSLLSHNLVLPLLGERASDAKKVRIARLGVAGFGILAWLLALEAQGVYALIEESSALGSAGILVVVVFALFTRFGRRGSAYLALVAGLLVYVLGSRLAWPAPFVASLAAALGAYLLGAAGTGGAPRDRTSAPE